MTKPLIRNLILCFLLILLGMFYLDPIAAAAFKKTPGPIHEFFKAITDIGLAGPYFAISLLGILACSFSSRDKLKRKKGFFVFLFTSLASAGVLVTCLKALFGRRRPFHEILFDPHVFDPLTLDWNFHSFPSGHTQVAFTVGSVLSLFFPKYKLFWYSFSLIIGLSRVITTAHFFSDAVFGAFIGWSITHLLYKKVFQDRLKL